MISWGSFLLGGLVFSIFSFFMGVILGNQSAKLGSDPHQGSSVYSISKDILKHLVNGETLSFYTYITKSEDDDSGNDSTEESWSSELPEELLEQDWRNN